MLETLFQHTPEIITLDNGLTVVFQQDQAHPLFSAQVWIRTGSIHEGPRLASGLSHFLEHMLFKGTGKRGPGEVAREVQGFGGQINAYTAFDRTVYYIDGPSEALAQALDLLADMTLNASLPENEVEKEKEVILREIDMTLDDPDRMLSRALFSETYREHPFRYPVIGLRPLFEKVNRDVLVDYYHARYQPANMVLSVAGDFDRQAFIDQLASTFGTAPRGLLQPVPIPREEPQLAFREVRLFGDYQTSRGLLAFKIPSMRHPDAPALDILGAILGTGHSGRLRQRLREERHLVHNITASPWNPATPGLFFIQYQCSPENAAEAEQAVLETCTGFAQEGFTEEELEKARRFACISEVQARQTSSGLASRLGLIAGLVGDTHYPRRYFEKIFSLTTDDLAELARVTFRPEKSTLATLQPEANRVNTASRKTAPPLPLFEEKVLSNGARLYWQRDPRLPRTWMRFAGLGGPLYEVPETRGSTCLWSTLLTRDTTFRSAAEVAGRLESSGGFMSDSCGNNTFAISLECMPDGLDLAVQTLQEALFHPAFKAETLERERHAQVSLIQEIRDEVLDYGRLALRRHFFGGHPFATHPWGTPETVQVIDEACLRDLHSRLLVGRNAVLVLAGDFDPERAIPKLETMLRQLPDGPFAPVRTPFTAPATTGELTETLEREQAIVLEAYPDVGFKPEADLIASVLDEFLSDMSGPLFHAVREDQSLAYFVGVARLLGYDFGCFYLYAGTHPKTVEGVYRCFETELERLRQGEIDRKAFQAALTRMKVQNRFSLQKAVTRATRVSMNALYGKPIMDWLDYESRLDAMEMDQLSGFANTMLAPGNRLRLTITPKFD